MGLYFNKDVNSLYLGSNEVSSLYFGGTQLWPVGLAPGTVFNFEYTGNVQEVTLPKGKYKLQCWGAQGGNVTGSYAATGSKGGYSEGILNLNSEKTLYVFVGGKGSDYTSSASQTTETTINGGWNGGGAGKRTSYWNDDDVCGRSFPRPGGGATDICLTTSNMNYSSGRTNRSSESLLSRFIVAGGGAGASSQFTQEGATPYKVMSFNTTATNENEGRYYATKKVNYHYAGETVWGVVYSSKGTYKITAYDSSGSSMATSTSSMVLPDGVASVRLTAYAAALGDPVEAYLYSDDYSYTDSSSSSSNMSQQGGGTSGGGSYPGTQSSGGTGGGAFGLGANQDRDNYRYCAGGGGAGWYGGGTAYSDDTTSYINYSGGGSGFVNISSNASYRPSGYTGLELESGTTILGNTNIPAPFGDQEWGHEGNGYARITVI